MSKASLELGGTNWGTKDGNLLAYAQGNESSNLVPREFTFTRGSDIAATRINSSGVIEKYRENLLLHSNAFNNWTNSNTTETSGQIGYDGSSDAWLLEKSLASGFIFRSFSGSGVYTLSLYAKAGTLNSVLLLILASGGNGDAYFNLSTGVVDQFGNNAFDAQIEDVGGGWYRCSLIGNYTSISQVRIYPANNQGIADTSGTIYIQDAQVEQGLVATSYLESGATKATSGVADNEPRIDYAGGTASLLLEPQRTNSIPYSEYFGGWNLFNRMTPTANDATSPEGLQNAYKIETTDTGAYFRDAQTISAGNNVFSIFAKKGNARYIFLASRFFNGFTDTYVWFDIENGTKGGRNGESFDYDIEDYGNGWYRCYLVHNVDASDLFGYAYVGLTNTDLNISGEGGLNGYFYGGQWEAGSYPTSYIPTYGTSVTRNADDCGGAGTFSTFNDTEGVLFIDLETSKNASPAQITINDGTYDNRIIFEVRPDAAFIKALINSSGTNVYDVSVSASPSTAYKVAIKYSANDIAFFVNGVKETSTTTTTAMPTGLSDLSFTGKESDGTLRFIGNVKQTLVFNTALSDRELVDLTSPYSTYQELVTAEGLTWESPTCTTNSITELQSI